MDLTATVLVAGSANLDFVVRAARIPAPGETVLGREFRTFPGGKGANQAIASARAGGAATRMLLALGDDAYAVPIEASLRQAGVSLDVVRSTEQPSGTAFICVSDDAENAITVAPGANALLRAEHLPALAGVTHLLLQLETPLATVDAYARAARAAGVQVVLNAAPAQALPDELLNALDLLIVNEGELAAISGISDDVPTALARIAVPTVIVTLGAHGCLARSPQGLVQQAGFAVDAVDTTAAGDTFCGALTAALSRGEPLAAGLAFASAAAAIACTRLGAQSSIPTLAEVRGFLEAHRA
ncbi:MAG TPA: ribokinase [Burkholderiaceae bacterium]